MKITSAFLRSRVARRLFLLFLLCALVPIGLLGLLSVREVGSQLREQREDGLVELSRAQTMTVYERINLLHSQLLRSLETSAGAELRLPDAFVAAAVGTSNRVTLEGQLLGWPHLPDPTGELERREPVLVSTVGSDRVPRLLIGVGRGNEGVFWAEVESAYLWWGPAREKTLALNQELHVFGADFSLLYTTLEEEFGGESALVPDQLRPDSTTGSAPNRGAFEWKTETQSFLGGLARLPPHHGGLAIVVSEPISELLAPLETFKVQFLLVLFAALLSVLLASASQIRRSLDPLEKLQHGTRRIARREFDTPVEIDSGDEFEELADSFNSMSSTLARQFAALTTMSEIGQSVLSKLASESVVISALDRVGEVLPMEAVALTLFDSAEPGIRTRTWFRLARSRSGAPSAAPVELSGHLHGREIELLHPVSRSLAIERPGAFPPWLAPFESVGAGLHVFPLRIEGELCGALSLGNSALDVLTDEDLDRARQLTDQIAVALSNARLVSNLEQLSNGTLTALARAVDTKSSWTRGHSERVAISGRLLGRTLGMGEEEQDLLYRGGMLHDIGKIGVPSAILDKPGKLDEREWVLMRSHVEKGARILEPIPGFDEVLPIVWEHHERIDGRGYPKGLRGDQISLHGKIFAIVDVFDAIRSRRPYRGSVDFHDVVGMIREGSGTEFEPTVVEAFLEVSEEINLHCWDGEIVPSAD